MSDKENRIIVTIILIVLALFVVFWIWGNTPTGRATVNNYIHKLQEVENATNYKIKKEVEDSCRAMISSYYTDRLTYEQYKDADSEEIQSWAEQAKMRANKTASTYNNYVLANNYVWSGNIPEDIKEELEYLE